MTDINIGINGFGRIGRTLFRLLEQHPRLRVTAINDLADARTLAHLLKYDSIHGKYQGDITYTENQIQLNERSVALSKEESPATINWAKHKVDIVVEASGKFKYRAELQEHLSNGAKKVILTVPRLRTTLK